MGNGQVHTLIHYLRRLAGPHQAGGLADGQLLERFVGHRDEAAFEVLVWRHGPMVLNVCRRLLHHSQDAEDAFQATFLAFVRKAASIRKEETVAAWLYRVAYRVALRARGRSARQVQLEQRALPTPAAEPLDEVVWRDLRLVLDEAVNRLPEKFRTPIVLCYLQGKTHQEAARQLGCPLGTVVSRLARARERLRAYLGRRGLAMTVGGLASVLVERSGTAALPGPLVRCTIHAGLLYAAGGGTTAGVVAAPVAALTEGVLRSMLLTKWIVVSTVVLFGCGIGTSVVGLRGPWLAAQQPERPAANAGRFASRRDFEFRGVAPGINGFKVSGDFLFLNSLEYQIPVLANDTMYTVPFVDSGTVEPRTELKDYRVSPGSGLGTAVPMLGPVPLAIEAVPGTPLHRDAVNSHESDGAFLQWKWEKAKLFYQEITTETDQQLKVMGQDVTQKQKQTLYLRWTPHGKNQDGHWVVTQRVEGVKIDIDIGGARLQFDSTSGKGNQASPLPDADNRVDLEDYYNRVDKKNTARAVASNTASPLADYYKALIGAEFQLAIPPDPRGLKIEGLDQFFRKLAPQYASLRAQSFADYKQMLAVWLMAVPEQWVRVGDTWTRKSKFSMNGQEVDATYRYTYAGTEGPLDKITVRAQLQYRSGDTDKPERFPVFINKIDLRTSEGTGVILFDRFKGRVVRSEMTLDLEGPMTMILAGKENRVVLKQRQRTTVRTTDADPLAGDPKEENRRLKEENQRLKRRLEEIERALKDPSAKKPQEPFQVFSFWAGFFH